LKLAFLGSTFRKLNYELHYTFVLSELPFNKLYGFLNHSFPNETCQTGSTDSSCPEGDVNVRTGECYLSSILRTISAKPYLKVREYRENE